MLRLLVAADFPMNVRRAGLHIAANHGRRLQPRRSRNRPDRPIRRPIKGPGSPPCLSSLARAPFPAGHSPSQRWSPPGRDRSIEIRAWLLKGRTRPPVYLAQIKVQCCERRRAGATEHGFESPTGFGSRTCFPLSRSKGRLWRPERRNARGLFGGGLRSSPGRLAPTSYPKASAVCL